jgi:hypothetical protein
MRAGIASALVNRKRLREGKIRGKRRCGPAILPDLARTRRESAAHGRRTAQTPDSRGILIY